MQGEATSREEEYAVPPKCDAVTDNDLPCQRVNYCSMDSEKWMEHPGGHRFASQETMDAMRNDHVDAKALLSGERARCHPFSECQPDGMCFLNKN